MDLSSIYAILIKKEVSAVNQPNFIIRFVMFFVPLAIFLFLMVMAGVTDNLFVAIMLALAFVWMLQAVYKRVLAKKNDNANNK